MAQFAQLAQFNLSHHLTTSPPHHLTTSPPHHLTTSPSHHLTISPSHHLTISPFPTLDTARLRLRELAAADIPAIVALLAEPAIAEMTLNIPYPYHEPDAVYWLNSAYQGFQRNEQYVFAVEQRATGEFMGGIELTLRPRFDRAEAGYWLGRPFWGQGFATEALRALLGFGFDALALRKIMATHLTKNPASGRVMQKAGMHREAATPQHVKRDGHYHDLIQYQLLRTDYQLVFSPAAPAP